MTPRFLSFAEVEAIHSKMLRDHFEMAAAYAFDLAESQAYMDGNKRTGAAAALVFLELNGLTTQPGDWLARALLDVASGRLDKAGLALVLEAHAKQTG